MHGDDLERAQKACDELKQGDSSAHIALIKNWQSFFTIFIAMRLGGTEEPQTILNDFLSEMVLKHTICDYDGRKSLKAFLLTRLHWRICDHLRKSYNRLRRQSSLESICEGEESDFDHVPSNQSPDQDLSLKNARSIVHEALLRFEADNPVEAERIRLRYFEEMDYKEIARQELAGLENDEKYLKRKSDAIRKQFTRNHNGTHAKFREILQKVMGERKIDKKGLLDLFEI